MKWLIGEMLPPAIASELNAMGHDAVSVAAAGLGGAPDDVVYAEALANDRVMVTENASDFAAIVAQRHANDEPCVPVVLVRKSDHPSGGALAHHLARSLNRWAASSPDPYPGPHWP